MTVSERLTEVRKNHGYTRTRLAEELKKPYRTITNYETGEREPGHDYIIKIAKMFGVTTDYLLGLSDNPQTTSEDIQKNNISNNEIHLVKKYRALDEHGKKVIDMLINEETNRIEKASTVQIAPSKAEIIPLPEPLQSASAGYGDFADDEIAEYIPVFRNNITAKADYVMRVHGTSMEPEIMDGQHVLVRQQPAVELGEIGIFIKDGERFIKVFCGNHLEAINPDYPHVPLDEYSRCVGKVLGVLKDEWIVKE